jgi:predicted DNA-binding transcriptional regulator AlpA
MKNSILRPKVARYIARLIGPLVDEGVISIQEEKIINSNLRSLATIGEPKPVILPKLLTLNEAAEILSIAPSNFRKIEKEGLFPFKRKLIGGGVRFRNLDIYDYAMSLDEEI